MEGGSIMSWQKCPICNGSGNDPWIGEIPLSICSYTKYLCPTCKGTRIISKLTGMPPLIEEKHSLLEPLAEPCLADDQSFFACTKINTQPRQNYSSDNSTQTTNQNGSNLSRRET
jgi:hypothetical protein